MLTALTIYEPQSPVSFTACAVVARYDDGEPDWLTVAEVASYVRCSRRAIYGAIQHGELKAAPINGRGDLRISRDWVSDWLNARADACVSTGERLREMGRN